MKLKKTEKLVVSKKMFASTKTSKKKDIEEKAKKKKKKNTSSDNASPKKTPGPKKKQYTPRSKTASAEKDSLKSPAKTKMGKGADKNLGSHPPKSGVASGKGIDWAELGVQRCSGCNFTTNEEGIFAAHLSLCRLYNKHKIKSTPKKKQVNKSDSSVSYSHIGTYVGIPDDRAMMLESYREGITSNPKLKSPSPSPTKKKQTQKSDILVNFVEKQAGHLRRMVSVTEKQAVIQEPYLEGSSPAQTVFLFRCYHCRSYFINIQTLKDHHRMAHGNKNLTVSLVPFTDDEPPEDINKKIIVDASRIVPTVNYRKEGTTVYSRIPLQSGGSMILTPTTELGPPKTASLKAAAPPKVTTPPTPPKPASSTVVTFQSHTETAVVTPPTPPSSAVFVPPTPPKTVSSKAAAPPTPPKMAPSAVVTPPSPPKAAHSETITRDVTVMKKPSQEMHVQVTSSSDKGTKSDEKAAKKGPIEIQKYLTGQSNPKVVLTPTCTANQSTTNKMVVLNLIPKSQSVPCSPVQIEIPANSPLNTQEYLKQIPNLAKAATKAIQKSQEGSKNWNSSAKNKAILPKSILMGVRQPPIELPLMHQTSKIGSNPGVTIISTAQKIIQSAGGQFTNASGVTSTVGSTKQTNRKIILFPLTSNASNNGSLVAPGTTLTATPAAAAITTNAVVTCATTTSPSMATPLPSSLAGSSVQTAVSPMLISSAPAVITSNGTVIPSVWVVPSQTGSTSVGSKQSSMPKQNTVLPKTIHIKPTAASTRITQSTSTSLSMTTQTMPPVMASSTATSPNRLVTITPVSETSPTAAGMSLLEKVSNKPKKAHDKSDLSSSDSSSPKQGKTVGSKGVPSASSKRRLPPGSDVSISIVSPPPKKKAHISSQTSVSKSPNPNNLESAPSLSASSSKGSVATEDFTLALVAKKKGPVSTTCASAIKNSLNASGTASANPLVIVRKSVGSNKLIVHTMVSANRLFQIQDSNKLSCSLCTAKINRDLMRNHLYWHFHVENRNFAKCSLDHRCHYCSVIDYVISMIPKSKSPEKPEDISSQTSQKTLAKKGQLEGDFTISHNDCSTVECSGDSSDTEPLGLKISSTFSLQKSQELNQDLETRKKTEKQAKSKEARLKSTSALPKITTKDKESREEERGTAGSPLIDVENTDTRSTAGSPLLDVENTDERSTAGSPIVDVENIDETENVQTIDSPDEEDISEESVSVSGKESFKTESPSQAEKNTIYKGNFYICGFKECTFSSQGMEEFRAHQEKKHAKASGYSCVHCQLECLEPEVLVHHMETHLCGDMFIHYRCAFPECNFGTNLMKSFTQHNVGAHPRETVFLCYYCNANFQGCAELHKHLRANLLKYVHCPHCSVRNGVRDTILSHIKSDHPDKPRRIFVTGQMVCHQKQKVLNRSMFTDYESDSSSIDSDCMIVDDEILDRHLIKQTNIDVHDIFEKSGKETESGKDPVHPITISDRKNSGSDDEGSDCMIVYEEQSNSDEKTAGKRVDPRQTCSPSSNVSANVDDRIQDDTDSNARSTTNLTKPSVLKKNEGTIPKQTGSVATKSVLKTPQKNKKEKNCLKDSANRASVNTDKDGSESEEGSAYLRVKKVAHTYSRQKKTQSKQQQLEESRGASNQKFGKDKTPNSDENSNQDSTALVKSCKRRILVRNKLHGRVDVGTMGLDSIISPLYLFVGNEVHCRICTFQCGLLQKMHSHIILMHLHVFLYECRYCHKKCSCKVEMTEHCELHGHNNRGFMNLPEPDWDQVIRSCLPGTCKASILKSVTDMQTSPNSDKAKLTKMQNSLSPKKSVSFTCKRKSLEELDSVGCMTVPSTKENSSERSSSRVTISSNEDRNIFSLFSFGLESEAEESRNLDSDKLSKQSKLDSSFSSKLFTLPSLPSSDKTPVKDQPALPQRTPTPEGHDRLTVAKEKYMKKLHLISISKVSNSKHPSRSLTSFGMSRDQLSKYPPMARLRSWRTALKRTPSVAKSSQTKKSTPLPRRAMLITPKTVRKKVVPKTGKLKMRKVSRGRPSGKGHLLRSATKLRHSPRTLKSRMGVETRKCLLKNSKTRMSLLKNPETRKSLLKNPDPRKSLLKNPDPRKSLLKNPDPRKSLLKNPEKGKSLLKNPEKGKSLLKNSEKRKSLLKSPEKYVARLRPQNLKSPSSSPHKKSTQSISSKPKLSKHMAVNRKEIKSTSRKLVKASFKTVVQKKNLTISHGQQSIKKALNQASRKSSSVQRKARLLRRKRMMRRGRPLKISSSLNIDANAAPADGANCLFFSCSWCQFKVTDREHFQRHISLHNFFPQGCKMYCPYCSYTTPNALILEKHIPMHMDKHPFGCRHCGFSAKAKMMVVRHCKRSHPDIPVKLVNRSTSSQKLKPSWPVVSFSPKVRLKKCAHIDGRFTCQNLATKSKDSPTKKFAGPSK